MSHHSSEDAGRMDDMMRKLFGEYPDGRMNANDAGAIPLAVGVENGRVTLSFPKPVAWIGFTADEAIGLAEALVKHARKAGSTKPLRLHIG